MKRKYNEIVDEVSGKVVYWYLENGYKISFTADPANADYQEYLTLQPAPTVEIDE